MSAEEERRRERFEVGDEVIGDEDIRGTIVGTNDVCQSAAPGYAETIREYLVKSEKGDKFLYAGESNLRLIKRGTGKAAPPRPDLLRELIEDLTNRPLAGLRL